MAEWEPLLFSTDGEGDLHFATRPAKTIIDIQSFPVGKWIEMDRMMKTVSFTLDGETLTYRRVAKTLAGHWACERVG